MPRKSPIKHKVRSYTKKNKKIQSYTRGHKTPTLAKPTIKVTNQSFSKLHPRQAEREVLKTKNKISKEFYEETKKKYPLVKKSGKWEMYDDKAGGMVFNIKTMEGWCLGEPGMEEKRFPPPEAWYRLGLDFKTIHGVLTITWNKQTIGKMDNKAKKSYIQRAKGYRLQSGKLQLYVATDKTAINISTRNRKIMTILRAEEATSSRELSRRLGLREQTILVELKYLEKQGFVRKVK